MQTSAALSAAGHHDGSGLVFSGVRRTPALFAILTAAFVWPGSLGWGTNADASQVTETPTPVETQTISRPAAAAAGQPRAKRRMHIGFYVNAIREVDWTKQNFLVDFYWWIRYPEPHSAEDMKLAEALEFVNGNLESLKHEEQEGKTVKGPDGDERYVAYRTVGRFYFETHFRSYPFDRQRLPIIIEHEVLTANELELVDDKELYRRAGGPEERWGLAPTVQITDLEIERATREFTTQVYQTNFGDSTIVDPKSSFARVMLTIDASRDYGGYLIKILIPLLIILALAYLVFFIPARELGTAVSLTVTSVLACIAFQLTVAGDLPSIGYVVTSDRIFHLSYFLIMVAMAETVYTHSIEKRGRKEAAARIEHWARYLYPGLFVLGVLVIVAHGVAGR